MRPFPCLEIIHGDHDASRLIRDFEVGARAGVFLQHFFFGSVHAERVYCDFAGSISLGENRFNRNRTRTER